MNVIQEPYKLNEINFNNIVFKKTKLIGNKKIIFLKYKDNKLNNFVIQLSKIINNNVNNSNEIEFIIDNENYINFFEKLDNYIINQSQINQLWFNHLENKSLNYQRILQDNNSIKLKLCDNKELVTNLLVNNENVTNFDYVNSHKSTTKMILEIYAIWIKNNSFGLMLRPINIAITLKEKLVYNYKFLNDSDNDSDNEVTELSASHFQTEINNKSFYNNNDDSNDDSNDDNNDSNDDNNDSNYESNDDNDDSNNIKSNNNLFIKTHELFNNNLSFTSTDDLENDLNKLILS